MRLHSLCAVTVIPTLSLAAAVLPRQGTSPSVTLTQGSLSGVTTAVPGAPATVNKFLGVRYAQPPNRFEKPVPIPAGRNTDDNSAWRSKCYESVPSAFSFLADNDVTESEDCLFLNVYVPNTSTKGKAVFFWIFGGDLQFGNGGQRTYDGASLAAFHDIIVVTINYRTNIFGFPNSPQLGLDEQNLGFYDQRLALQWVQQNIKQFGGDPDKITLAGQSSGGASVDRFLQLPPQPAAPATVPFRAAIYQSGQASISPVGTNSSTDGRLYWNIVADAVGCPAHDLTCMKLVNAEVLKTAVQSSTLLTQSVNFQPVTDHVTQKDTPLIDVDGKFLPAAEGRLNVPTLIGSNADETSIFLKDIFTGTLLGNVSVLAKLDQLLGPQAASRAVKVLGTITQSQLFFSELTNVTTQIIDTCTAHQVSHASASTGTPTWRYYYNTTYPDVQELAGGPPPNVNTLGAYHSAEIRMAFGSYAEAPPAGVGYPDHEMVLSSYMLDSWGSFVNDPTAGPPGWKPVSTSGDDADINCIGCSSNPTGVYYLKESDVDASCNTLWSDIYEGVTPAY